MLLLLLLLLLRIVLPTLASRLVARLICKVDMRDEPVLKQRIGYTKGWGETSCCLSCAVHVAFVYPNAWTASKGWFWGNASATTAVGGARMHRPGPSRARRHVVAVDSRHRKSRGAKRAWLA
jgi:hypothetical protein